MRLRHGASSRRVARAISAAGLTAGYVAASLRRGPRHSDLASRLSDVPRHLPLRRAATIRWNDHQVPFIQADDDRDAAVALGAVHAHLRLSQIEMMRRIAAGRLAETFGPAAVPFDHGLRLLDIGRAAPEIEAGMPEETRMWLQGFADGLNGYIAQMRRRPFDLEALDVTPGSWTVRDLVVLGRLASLDFTWRVWLRLMRLRGRSDWLRLWGRLVGTGVLPVPSLAGSAEQILDGLSRSGSNSLAVAGHRSATGSALIASDPHLPVVLPNLWLLTGLKSPGYHMVGLMIPGVPAVALGRNARIAWGGTSLHAASSDLFDVGADPDCVRTRRERVKVRWARDVEVELRESRFGPVISDAEIFGAGDNGPLALRWIGHSPTDELTALLRVNRAGDWDEFTAALDGFAIPAQNMTYADAEGRVGQAMAAQVPRRPRQVPGDMVVGPSAERHWDSLAASRDLPSVLDPAEGFVASANNAPEAFDPPVGFFFAPDERIGRIRALLSSDGAIAVDDLRRLQNDVTLPSARRFRDILLKAIGDGPERDRRVAALIEALAEWDGAYDAESRGALAFELVVFHLVEALHGRWEAELYVATWDAWSLLTQDLERTEPSRLATAAGQAVAASARTFVRLGTWGRAHRLRIMHPFGRVPLAGRRFRSFDLPAAGGNETVMKTAFGFAAGRHEVRFGAVARHISDLSDPDANSFVLLGGQDGWLGSATFADQVALWRNRAMIPMPMSETGVTDAFVHVTPILPETGRTAP